MTADEMRARRLTGGLLGRLRHETGLLHQAVEMSAGLPASVHTRAEYADLISRFAALHAGFEAQLTDQIFHAQWLAIGIELDRHIRTPQLAVDLAELGFAVPTAALELPELHNFSEAIGCLYVLEGSALGGRILAAEFGRVLGDLPSTFLNSVGRGHPAPWRSVVGALRSLDAEFAPADLLAIGDGVTKGARKSFKAFEQHLGGRHRTVALHHGAVLQKSQDEFSGRT